MEIFLKLLKNIAVIILFYILHIYCSSWRIVNHNKDKYFDTKSKGLKPVVAIWHDQLLPCTFAHRAEGVVTIASDSKDGSIITSVLTRWKFHIARGSSSRGALKATLNAIKLANTFSATCALTVDGPKGPRHIVKDGAIFIAKKLDQVILLTVMSTKHFKRFASWDKFILPLPFAKIDIFYSDPIYLSENIDKDSIAADTQMINKLMLEFTNEHSHYIL